MGSAISKGILSGLGASMGGIIASIFAGPAGIPILAASLITGAVSGSAAAMAELKKEDAMAATGQQIARAKELAMEVQRNKDYLVNEAKNGAFGPDVARSVNIFTEALKSGKATTINGALQMAGLTPGWGTASDARERRAISKHLGNGTGLTYELATRFGDPMHRSMGWKQLVGHAEATHFQSILDSQAHAAWLNSTTMSNVGGGAPVGTSQAVRNSMADASPGGGVFAGLVSGKIDYSQTGVLTSTDA